MVTRFRLLACLASLVAVIASRENAASTQKVAPAQASSPILYTDGSIIRFAQDDPNEDAAPAPAPDNSDTQDDSGQSSPPTESPE